ncbi:hypothetical protein ACRS52_06080 [Bacillus cytotoxicus]|uniref:hypothetical protein n=1 Tax=Bacillus cytotoxicus TaxID=580165 RepID=UPI001AEE1CDD|nr:hypothetical protein [Bacillus cytotoxicus]QTR88973.1 hypothetical protein JC774_11085 [Bacillus cytotoxicus]
MKRDEKEHKLFMQVITLTMLDDGYTIHQILKMFKTESGRTWHAWIEEKQGEGQ